jgi:hypothetical protein
MAFNPTADQEAKCKAFAQEVTFPMANRYLLTDPHLLLKFLTASGNLDHGWFESRMAPGATTRMGTKVITDYETITKQFREKVDKITNR